VLDNEQVFATQLPADVNCIYIKIEGPNGFVEVKHRSRFKNFVEMSDRGMNSVLIQGPNQVAVRGLQARVGQLVEPQRFIIRTVFYRYPVFIFWTTLVLLWLGEYRIAKLFRPSISFYAPLSAGGAMLLFAVALGTLFLYANVIVRGLTYWFPYFEIEGNISRHRTGTQTVIGVIWTSLLATGVWNLISLLYGTAGH
jgi:hypothetical protein